MTEKKFLPIIILSLIVLLFTGCDKTDGATVYITFITVPTEATIPNGLRLDSILNITNPTTDDPNGPKYTAQFGVFGYTNAAGEPTYCAYGKKESIANNQSHLMEQGFYLVNYSRDNKNVVFSLKDGGSIITKIDKGKGVPTTYSDQPPLPFYTPVEGKTGLYSFVDATGVTQYRVYATFLDKNGNFFPAAEDGEMVPGALPINKAAEELQYTQGTTAVSKLLTTPINCTNIPTSYVV
jgi:hypothetical protein